MGALTVFDTDVSIDVLRGSEPARAEKGAEDADPVDGVALGDEAHDPCDLVGEVVAEGAHVADPSIAARAPVSGYERP